MASLPTPPAQVHAVRRDDLEERLLARRVSVLDLLIQDAKDVLGIWESGHFTLFQCATIEEYGERRLRISSQEARHRLQLGRAMTAFGELEGLIRERRVRPDNAALLDTIGRRPDLLRADDDWLGWAEQDSARAFRKRVDRRVRETNVQGPVQELTVFVTPQGMDDVVHAQDILSRNTARRVTLGEVVETTVGFWLDHNDLVRKEERARRMPDTRLARASGRRNRRVPATVERAILKQADGKCAIPYCPNRIVELAHIKAYAKGGGQESDELLPLCPPHHGMFDRGEMRAQRIDGGLRIHASDGALILEWRYPVAQPPPEAGAG